MLVQKIINCLSRTLKDVNCDSCDFTLAKQIVSVLWLVTNNNNNNNNNNNKNKLKIKNVEGPVIIYSLIGGEFWRITRFLGGDRGESVFAHREWRKKTIENWMSMNWKWERRSGDLKKNVENRMEGYQVIVTLAKPSTDKALYPCPRPLPPQVINNDNSLKCSCL